jgi:hypothetical protein
VEDICYLCGTAIEPGQRITGDHVVPVVFLGKKQPKRVGFDYAGRLRTHQACNNNFSDESFLNQAVHLLELVRTQQMHNALQSREHPQITILPVTPDQVPRFTGREFKRFAFTDARQVDPEALKDPAFYEGKKKVNLLRIAAQATMAVKAKSSAALLVKRVIKRVPTHWRIYATPFEIGDEADLSAHFGSTKPFGPCTRATMREVASGEWLVVYQHRNFLTFLLFILHERDIDPRETLSHPNCEIYAFFGTSINELGGYDWPAV